jgi:hypothetical protein
MSGSKKTPAADRSHGGPGSSQQDARKPGTVHRSEPLPGTPTNTSHSRASGGDSERDSHHTHAQLGQLGGAGCTKVYREKVTGSHSDRRELLKMLDALAPGDVVTVN